MTVMSEITLPFSYNYSNVIQLVSVLANSMLYFYLFWLTGTAILSYYFEFIKRDDASFSFAKILLNYPLKKLSFPLVLGLIPFAVIYSVDLIWLKGAEFNSIHNWTLVNIILFVISVILLLSYKSTFELITVLPINSVDKSSKEFLNLMEKTIKNHKRNSLLGTIGIVLTLFIFSILSSAKVDFLPTIFSFDFFTYLVDLKVYVRFLYLISVSLSLAFLGSLFFNFGWQETKLETSEGLQDFIKSKSLKGSIATILIQPLFILIELIILPKNSLSYLVFLSSGIAVIFIFIILNYLNAYGKENLNSYLKFSFYLVILVLISISAKDVVSVGNVLKPKTVEISEKFTTYEENLKSKLNIKTVSISGEEIFTAKCSACHRFDSKLVGPPYNVVLKKYENNREQLIKFILNPVKVDPAYPPMPAQGLIPPEAEAVADYILKVYKENSK